MDDCEDLDFCRFTVIITCSCTRCLPDVPVFIFWSEGRASVELSWSWKHSYASAVLSGEWFMAAGGAGRGAEGCGAAVRARVASAAPYGHRALVRARAPGCCCWRLRPARFVPRQVLTGPALCQTGYTTPALRHPLRHSDASCRALPLPGGRWGVCRARGVPGVHRSQARPSSPGEGVRPGRRLC